MFPKIVILAGPGLSTDIVCQSLMKDFNVIKIIIEDKPSSIRMIQRRVKKLGWFKVFGQILFIIFNRLTKFLSKKRIEEIIGQHDLKPINYEAGFCQFVNNINSDKVCRQLKALNPDVVVINGTRILSKKILEIINIPFLNIHTGITPKYRGVHGGYWALVNKDETHCGVTVHCVDAGIDTGNIVFQKKITVEKSDNFNTYPILQVIEAIPLLKKAIKDIQQGSFKTTKPSGESSLWYHPTLWGYLLNRWFKGIK